MTLSLLAGISQFCTLVIGSVLPVPSLLKVLQETLKRLRDSPEFGANDPHAAELWRWLLVTIGDLEDQRRDAADKGGDQACAGASSVS